MLVTNPAEFLGQTFSGVVINDNLTLFNLEGTQCRAEASATERREPSFCTLKTEQRNDEEKQGNRGRSEEAAIRKCGTLSKLG